MDLGIEPGSDYELRDGIMGGTVEADMGDRGLETPIFSMESKTSESSCPSWLRKVCTLHLHISKLLNRYTETTLYCNGTEVVARCGGVANVLAAQFLPHTLCTWFSDEDQS